MNENISRLMDGELDDAELDRCMAELKSADATQTWACYHVTGDTLRGEVAGSMRATRTTMLLSRWITRTQ